MDKIFSNNTVHLLYSSDAKVYILIYKHAKFYQQKNFIMLYYRRAKRRNANHKQHDLQTSARLKNIGTS